MTEAKGEHGRYTMGLIGKTMGLKKRYDGATKQEDQGSCSSPEKVLVVCSINFVCVWQVSWNSGQVFFQDIKETKCYWRMESKDQNKWTWKQYTALETSFCRGGGGGKGGV